MNDPITKDERARPKRENFPLTPNGDSEFNAALQVWHYEKIERLRWALAELRKEICAVTPDWNRALRIIDQAEAKS